MVITNEYFILLEDDVLLMNPITIETLKYDVNGCNKNEFLDSRVAAEIRAHNEKLRN